MPNPSTPCGRATPETAVFYPFGHPTPYAYTDKFDYKFCPKMKASLSSPPPPPIVSKESISQGKINH
jgi:hypothetical protein